MLRFCTTDWLIAHSIIEPFPADQEPVQPDRAAALDRKVAGGIGVGAGDPSWATPPGPARSPPPSAFVSVMNPPNAKRHRAVARRGQCHKSYVESRVNG
ncbi:unnamed protein product, partial [Iphiclides podalirius]